MPMSQDFKTRLDAIVHDIAAHFGTPFHIYDEKGIRETGATLEKAFRNVEGFREFFAVKALPNPRILEIMRSMGFGFDCSSVTEIILARKVGGQSQDIMFTSNNTSAKDFGVAFDEGGVILNLDDISLISKAPHMPDLICFRYNPGSRRTGNDIIGNPVEAKYGLKHEHVCNAYAKARDLGARRFGLHTMLASNERNYTYVLQTASMLIDLVEEISRELSITFDFINIGGGLGIPYKPEDEPFDIHALGKDISNSLSDFKYKHGYAPNLYMESGRYITGPHGVLVTTAINRKDTYRTYIGVDANMSALMRPGMYGAYHHITVPGKDERTPTETADVVGSLCENNDKFAIQRPLPPIADGDILVIHDTGAHGHSMGFNYNGQLRPKELLLRADGDVELIRRAETEKDYFATLNFEADVMSL